MTKAHRWTVRDLRRGNRAELLRTLHARGVLSRQQLAAATGLSPATVSNVTADLIAEGVVVEAGQEESEGGRPRVLLRVNPRYAYLVGVDVGESRLQAELFDLGMRPLAREVRPLPPDGPSPQAAVSGVLDAVTALLAADDGGAARERLLGVGVGVPGIVATGPGEAVHARTLGWDGVPLQRLLREGLRERGTAVPLFVDNGAITMGQAELRFGAGRGARHAALLLLGSGVGGCFVVDGKPFRGASGSAGEWGHTPLALDGRPCRCGARGCLEAYIGATAILERWREAEPGLAADADLDTLCSRASTPGTTAAAVLGETLDYLGAGLAGLVNLLNPDRIVVSGTAGLLLGQGRLDRIRTAVEARALARPFGRTELVLGELGADAVAMGAATLVLEEFLSGSHGDEQWASAFTS